MQIYIFRIYVRAALAAAQRIRVYRGSGSTDDFMARGRPQREEAASRVPLLILDAESWHRFAGDTVERNILAPNVKGIRCTRRSAAVDRRHGGGWRRREQVARAAQGQRNSRLKYAQCLNWMARRNMRITLLLRSRGPSWPKKRNIRFSADSAARITHGWNAEYSCSGRNWQQVRMALCC